MRYKSTLAISRAVASFLLIFAAVSVATAQNPQAGRQLAQGPTQKVNAQRRVALVIGNGAYLHAGRLANPPNDATVVAATLRQVGFEVKNGANLAQREMKRLIREFGQTLRANGGVGLFYFAGHGVQAKGRNYLIPVDADIQTEADLEDVGVDLNYVLNLMDEAQNGLNIVILDACRNNPFARSFRSAQEGLAQVKAPTGTLIAYATAPDSIAADGAGNNSPYTQELIKQMRASGVLLETMFRRVTEQVSSRTGGKQEPWFSANVKGDFYFTAGAAGLSPSTAGPANVSSDSDVSRIDPTAIELSYWETIKNSNDPADFRSYLEKYPNGQFVDLARRRAGALPAYSSTSTNSGPSTSVATEYMRSGDQLVKDSKWAEAVTTYKRAVDLEPDNVEFHNKLGYALHGNGRYSEAETEYRIALRLSPNNAEAHYGIGRTLREQNKLAESEGELRAAVRLEPTNAKYHAALGYTLGKFGQQWTEAEAELAESIRLEPNNAEWRRVLAELLARQGKYTAAEAEAATAISLEPNARSRALLAWVFSSQQKYAAAETEWREAIRLNPNEPSYHASLGETLGRQEKWAAAEAEIRQALRFNQQSAEWYANLSWVLRAQDKYSEAETAARDAVRLAPTSAYARAELAVILHLQSKAAEAEAEAREALRLNSNYGWAHRILGVILEKQERFREAEAEYHEAVRLDPRDTKNRELLEEIQSRKTYKISWGIRSVGGWSPSPGTLILSRKKFDIDTGDGKHLIWECDNFKNAVADDVWIREIKGKNSSAMFRLQFESKAYAAEALAGIKKICGQP